MSSFLDLGTLQPGSKTVFYNSAAPVGWVKETSVNDCTLRLVTGTVGSGGSTPFSTVYGGSLGIVTSGTTFLSSQDFPPHSHAIPTNSGGSTSFGTNASFDWSGSNGGANVTTTSSGTWNGSTETSGHLHSLSSASWDGVVGMPNFDVKYVLIISCIKD
jgi:hypothetical protein